MSPLRDNFDADDYTTAQLDEAIARLNYARQQRDDYADNPRRGRLIDELVDDWCDSMSNDRSFQRSVAQSHFQSLSTPELEQAYADAFDGTRDGDAE